MMLALLALSLAQQAPAQIRKQGPNGYLSVSDYQAGKPMANYIFYADKRSAALMKVSPGNDYKVECNDASIKKDFITDQLWGVVYKDTLYVNCQKFTGLDWFAKAEVTGRYVMMYIAVPINPKYKSEIGDWANAPAMKTGGMPSIPGLIGTVVTSAVDRLSTRVPVVYDLEKGQCRCLTTDLMYQYSEEYPQLKDKYGMIRVETLSVYGLRDFVRALNEADGLAKAAALAPAPEETPAAAPVPEESSAAVPAAAETPQQAAPEPEVPAEVPAEEATQQAVPAEETPAEGSQPVQEEASNRVSVQIPVAVPAE